MKSRLTTDLGLKLFSLLLGITLWYAVAREQGAEFVYSIPLELRDVPDGLEVIEESAQQVDVRLRGPAEILRRLTPQDLGVAVDLSDAATGERVVYLTPDDVAVPFGARVMRVTPASLQIVLDRTVERKVKVIPRVVGTPSEGFELYNILTSPQEIVVVGPASLVQELEQVTTEPLSSDGLRQPFTRSVRLELDPLIRLEQDTSVELTLDIREVRRQRELKDVPITARPDGVRADLSPASIAILVEGPKSVVEQLRPKDFLAELRLEGLGKGRYTRSPIVRVRGPHELVPIQILSVKPEEITVRVN